MANENHSILKAENTHDVTSSSWLADDLIIDLNTRLIIESNKPVQEVDLDILSIFFENRKHSDGGDLISFKRYDQKNEDLKAFELFYQDEETKKRVLARKFFSIGGYLLRASETGYLNQEYDLNRRMIIINNIDDSGLELNSSDSSIVKIYAEYLLPDNDVINLTKSIFINDTYLIEYSQEINKEMLMVKFNKKSKLRNREIKLFDSFETQAFIIKGKSLSSMTILTSMLTKLLEESQNSTLKYFIDNVKSDYFIIQFDCQLSNDLFEKLHSCFKLNNLLIEKITNFELIDHLNVNNSSESASQKSNNLKQIDLNKYVDKSIQTDDLPASTAISTSKVVISQTNNKLAPVILTSSNSNDQNNKKNNNDSCSASGNVYVLEADKYYTIGLVNSKQMFINFNDLIKRKYNDKIEAGIRNDTIRFFNKEKSSENTDWVKSILNDITEFFSTRALYEQIEVPSEILTNQTMRQNLLDNLSQFNKANSAVYFRLIGNSIHSFGTKNALNKRLESFPSLFKSIASSTYSSRCRSGSSQSENKQTNTKTNNPSNNQDLLTNYKFSKLIDSKSLLGMSLLNCKQIFNDFKSNLFHLNCDLVIIKNQVYVTSNLEIENGVNEKLNAKITDFETNNLKQKEISIPNGIRRPKEITDLQNHLKRLFSGDNSVKYKIVGDEKVNIYGYAKQIDRVNQETRAKFSNLENNIKDRIKTKLNLKVGDKKKNFQSIILYRFNRIYFNEFQNLLLKNDARLEKLQEKGENVNGYKVVCTVSDKNKLQDEAYVLNWRSKMDNLINTYFSKFINKRVQIEKSMFDSAKISTNNLVEIIWHNSTCAELIGLKANVNKIEESILALKPRSSSQSAIKSNVSGTASSGSTQKKDNDSKKGKSAATTLNGVSANAASSNSTNKNGEKETFIINDLKWFQTHILFEKKYFAYVAEAFKNLVVLLDSQLTKIFFTGTTNEINLAKKLAFDILDQIIGAQIESNSGLLKKLIQYEKEYTALIKKNNLCCVIDAKSETDRFTIYGTKMEDIELCKKLVSEAKIL